MLLQKTRLLGYHSHLYLHVIHANCLVQHLFFFFHLAIIKTSLQPVRENTVFPNDLWLPGNR